LLIPLRLPPVIVKVKGWRCRTEELVEALSWATSSQKNMDCPRF
jgi:hypothetical protein